MWSKVLGSTRFWAALLAVVFVVLTFYLPAFTARLNEADVVTGVVAIALFIVAESVAGAGVGWSILAKPRFWALAVSFTFLFVKAFAPTFILTEAQIQELIASIGVASVGVSYRPIGTSK